MWHKVDGQARLVPSRGHPVLLPDNDDEAFYTTASARILASGGIDDSLGLLHGVKTRASGEAVVVGFSDQEVTTENVDPAYVHIVYMPLKPTRRPVKGSLDVHMARMQDILECTSSPMLSAPDLSTFVKHYQPFIDLKLDTPAKVVDFAARTQPGRMLTLAREASTIRIERYLLREFAGQTIVAELQRKARSACVERHVARVLAAGTHCGDGGVDGDGNGDGNGGGDSAGDDACVRGSATERAREHAAAGGEAAAQATAPAPVLQTENVDARQVEHALATQAASAAQEALDTAVAARAVAIKVLDVAEAAVRVCEAAAAKAASAPEPMPPTSSPEAQNAARLGAVAQGRKLNLDTAVAQVVEATQVMAALRDTEMARVTAHPVDEMKICADCTRITGVSPRYPSSSLTLVLSSSSHLLLSPPPLTSSSRLLLSPRPLAFSSRLVLSPPPLASSSRLLLSPPPLASSSRLLLSSSRFLLSPPPLPSSSRLLLSRLLLSPPPLLLSPPPLLLSPSPLASSSSHLLSWCQFKIHQDKMVAQAGGLFCEELQECLARRQHFDDAHAMEKAAAKGDAAARREWMTAQKKATLAQKKADKEAKQAPTIGANAPAATTANVALTLANLNAATEASGKARVRVEAATVVVAKATAALAEVEAKRELALTLWRELLDALKARQASAVASGAVAAAATVDGAHLAAHITAPAMEAEGALTEAEEEVDGAVEPEPRRREQRKQQAQQARRAERRAHSLQDGKDSDYEESDEDDGNDDDDDGDDILGPTPGAVPREEVELSGDDDSPPATLPPAAAAAVSKTSTKKAAPAPASATGASTSAAEASKWKRKRDSTAEKSKAADPTNPWGLGQGARGGKGSRGAYKKKPKNQPSDGTPSAATPLPSMTSPQVPASAFIDELAAAKAAGVREGEAAAKDELLAATAAGVREGEAAAEAAAKTVKALAGQKAAEVKLTALSVEAQAGQKAAEATLAALKDMYQQQISDLRLEVKNANATARTSWQDGYEAGQKSARETFAARMHPI